MTTSGKVRIKSVIPFLVRLTDHLEPMRTQSGLKTTGYKLVAVGDEDAGHVLLRPIR